MQSVFEKSQGIRNRSRVVPRYSKISVRLPLLDSLYIHLNILKCVATHSYFLLRPLNITAAIMMAIMMPTTTTATTTTATPTAVVLIELPVEPTGTTPT